MNESVDTAQAEAEDKPAQEPKGLMRKIYWWVLSWADTPYGTPALFTLAVAESSFFPIPPDPLLLALAAGKPSKSFFYAAICTAGSVIGGMIGYAIGYFFIESIGMKIVEFYGVMEAYGKTQQLYEQYNAIVVLMAAVTPIPYKVFTISGGAFQVSFIVFVLASIAGRGFRFFLVGTLIYFYGRQIRDFIDKYMSALSWLFGILLVGGFVLVKFLMS